MTPTETFPATITGLVTFTPGEGMPMVIPQGPVTIELTTESATLGWTADNGAAGRAAITFTQYTESVRDGLITLDTPATAL